MKDYQTAERHSTRVAWGDVGIRVIILLISGLTGLAVFGLYMAYAKHPQVMIGLAWLGWIGSMAWAFTKVAWYKRRVEMLESMLFQRGRVAPYSFRSEEPEIFEPKGDYTEKEVLQIIRNNKDNFQREELDELLQLYRQSKTITGELLNIRKKFSRSGKPGDQLHPYPGRTDSPSPTVDLGR